MALYATEKVRVISRITDYDGDAITGTDGVDVTLSIWDPDGDAVLTDQAMAWNPTGNPDGPYWYYDWDSESNPVGRYKTEAHASGGGDDIDAFDFGSFRLRRRPSGTGTGS